MLKENLLTRKFKVIFSSILAPGPGNYRLPSDFGYYVNKTFYKKSKNTDKNENSENLAKSQQIKTI